MIAHLRKKPGMRVHENERAGNHGVCVQKKANEDVCVQNYREMSMFVFGITRNEKVCVLNYWV